ncbi:hypothetical protein CH49_906 [Yersinia enterocolitica]|nr:hypothetical protein CH49_906 [Yersinia enterocolitica]CRY16477.1 Uncharacterised protein [Yersinia enterocolitica]CRY18075.1 Uncharacterised protein [Yersinia enterocolitica]
MMDNINEREYLASSKMRCTHLARYPYLYSLYFKLHVRWLRSITRITYESKLIGVLSLAAFLQLELFRVYKGEKNLTVGFDIVL